MLKVRYFAGAKDLAGCDEESFAVPAGDLTVTGLVEVLAERHPRIAAYLPRMRLAVDGTFAEADTAVTDGQEVDVMPPVAGGAPAVALCDVRDADLSIDEVYRAVSHDAAGGVVLFAGVVRDHHEGKSISRLDYEAHPTLAVAELRAVLEAVANEWPSVRLAAVHRVGQLTVGDFAIVLAASSPHRAEAFEACRAAIDRIKDTVPIWKKEWDEDGAPTWVNLEER